LAHDRLAKMRAVATLGLRIALASLLSLAFIRDAHAVTVDDFLPLAYDDGQGHTLPYRLFVPEGYQPGNSYPLVVFFHGAGERGTDNVAQLNQGACMVFADESNQTRWPVFMLAPQCPGDQQWVDMDWSLPSGIQPIEPTWPMAATMGVVDQLLAEYPAIDPERVYVTGLSMGGFGTWDAAIRWPERFAAAVPICGGGDEATVGSIVDLPLWTFHSSDDTVVSVDRSRNMIAALQALGGTPSYTEYCSLDDDGQMLPCWGHGAWDPAYSDPALLPWLYAQVKAGRDGGSSDDGAGEGSSGDVADESDDGSSTGADDAITGPLGGEEGSSAGVTPGSDDTSGSAAGDDDEAGCSCSTRGAGGNGLGLPLLLLTLRRRRRGSARAR
jgi:MYXO-CTERM domain-containing protein